MTESASDLIELARTATTDAELDDIESRAEGRVTVINAVHDRRDQLERQGVQSMPDPPVVDASPTQQPISVNTQSLEELLAQYPAPASPPEVLELKPNSAEDATEGPHPQVSATAYVHMTKPDGTEFLAPLSNVPAYEAKGFTAGAEEDIPDIGAYWAEKAKTT